MLVDTVAAVVVRCPECGKLNLVSESLFSLRAGGKEVSCICRHPLAVLRLDGKRSLRLELEIMCFLCEDWHRLELPISTFLQEREETLYCPDSGLELGLAGQPGCLSRQVEGGELEIMGMTGDLGLEDYFDDPEVVFEVLNHLYRLANQGNIVCGCGNGKVEFNLYAERVDLHCIQCGATLTIAAVSQGDLERVLAMSEIKLDSGIFRPEHFRRPPFTRKNP